MALSRRGAIVVILGAGLPGLGYVLHCPGPNPLGKNQNAFNPYLSIADDGTVTVAVPRAEMGQGVQTALAMVVADALDVPVHKVRVEHPLPSKHYVNRKLIEEGFWFLSPTNHGRWAELLRSGAEFASEFFPVMQITGGSSSVRDAWEPMRMAGLTAREMLLQVAAVELKADRSRLRTKQGEVFDDSGHSLTYGELAGRAAKIGPVKPAAPDRAKVHKPGSSECIGQRTPRLDTPDKASGKARFGIDVREAGMLYAAVRSAPTLSGRIVSYDDSTVPRDVRVVQADDRTVAVVAKSYWTAQRAVDGLAVTFTDEKTPLSSDAVSAQFAEHLEKSRAFAFRDDGDVEAQWGWPNTVLEAAYHTPYLAHVCMEPLNCTARVTKKRCELWLGTQAPGLVAYAVARDMDLLNEPGAVVVNTELLGGGFGRRLEVDVAVQAARIAKKFSGRPVKLIWSRAEDIRRDVFRPAASAELKGTVKDGWPHALFARICSQSVNRNFIHRNLGIPLPLVPDKTNAEGLFDQPYEIPHYRVEHVEAENEVPVGNWRSVGHSFNGFAMETFLDEMAREVDKDPFRVRRHLLRNYDEKVALLDRLQVLSEWGDKKPAGIDGRGMAYRQNFGSDVGVVVDIALKDKKVKVERVHCVIDCGPAVDPGGIEAQVESGIVFGLSAALMQEITIKDGRVEQSNFHQFDALRIHQCPDIRVCILQNNKWMGGAGETAVPPVAPALANAVFDATGVRVRRLPLSLTLDTV